MFRPCMNYKIKKKKEKDNGYIFGCLEKLQITGASIIDMVLAWYCLCRGMHVQQFVRLGF